MRLSFCMIVKNEAENLGRCLASVVEVADELLVLDTGSTDDTIAIAQSFGARVEQFAWTQNFSEARNVALQYLTGDWVLVLDADEVLVAEAVPQLRQAMQRETALVINLIRQEIDASQSPYSLLSRLFRRHPAISFSRPYHAMIDDSVARLLQQEPDWQIFSYPKVAILHYGYAPDAIASRNKLETARLTMERFLVQHPGDPYVCSKLGALYVQIGRIESGLELLQRGLKTPSDPPVRYELHYHLGIAHSRQQDWAEAERQYRTAIEQPVLETLKLGAFNNLGNLLQARGDWAAAQTAYQTCLTIDPNFVVGYYNLGMVLKAQGQLAAAAEQYQTAIRLNPSSADAHQNLAVVLLKLGLVAESRAAFQQAITLHTPTNPAEAERLRQGLKEIGLF